MTNTSSAVLAIAFLWIAVFVTIPAWAAWRRWRGTRIVTCPENQRPAAVDLDLRYAMAGAVVGRPELRLRDCSRWPQQSHCGQLCLAQVEESPCDCLVRTMLEEFYASRTCAYCRKTFGSIHWHDHKPALRGPDGRLVEWSAVAPEALPEVLLTHQAVCWNCLVAEGFRIRFTELVVDRPPRPRGATVPPHA